MLLDTIGFAVVASLPECHGSPYLTLSREFFLPEEIHLTYDASSVPVTDIGFKASFEDCVLHSRVICHHRGDRKRRQPGPTGPWISKSGLALRM
jgi:hypothetical protein